MKLLKTSALMAVLLTCAVLMLGVLSLRVQPARGGGGAVPATSLNGDLNCDGSRNITDAVYLLQYLFQGGQEPCAVAQEAGPCCPEVTAKLNEILAALQDPCKDPMSRLVENGDGTVTDLCTGLMWQKQYVLQDLDLDGASEFQFNSNQAVILAGQSRVGGHADWRLPRSKEFESLYRVSAERPYLQGRILEFDFLFSDGSYYWMAEVDSRGRQAAAPAPNRFDHGEQDPSTKNRVLLVRTGG